MTYSQPAHPSQHSRDLKPENILFESDKENSLLKIVDFGSAMKYEKSKKLT